jgi:hypothetical protein
MKIIFFEDQDLFDLAESIYKSRNNVLIWCGSKENLDLMKLFCYENQISFCDPRQTNSHLFDDDFLLRFFKSTIYFIEHEFLIQHFIEILSFFHDRPIVLTFVDFFDKRAISLNEKVDHLLGFDFSDQDEFDLIIKVVAWCKKFRKFSRLDYTRSLNHFFFLHARLLKDLLRIFLVDLPEINLVEWVKDFDFQISIQTYFEYLLSQDCVRTFETKADLILLTTQEIDFSFFQQNISILFHISDENELDNLLESFFIQEAASCEKPKVMLCLPLELKSHILHSHVSYFFQEHSASFHSFKKTHKKINIDESYKKLANQKLTNKDVIELNSFSVFRLLHKEGDFVLYDLFGARKNKNDLKVINSGYFDSILDQFIKNFEITDRHESDIEQVLSSLIKNKYHLQYFDYLFNYLYPIVSRYRVARKDLELFAKKNSMNFEIYKSICFELKLRSGDFFKRIKIKCVAKCVIWNEKEVFLYDFFSKNIDSSSFRQFKKPSIILAGSYFSRKFPGIKISFNTFNLENDEEFRSRKVKNVDFLIREMERRLGLGILKI